MSEDIIYVYRDYRPDWVPPTITIDPLNSVTTTYNTPVLITNDGVTTCEIEEPVTYWSWIGDYPNEDMAGETTEHVREFTASEPWLIGTTSVYSYDCIPENYGSPWHYPAFTRTLIHQDNRPNIELYSYNQPS